MRLTTEALIIRENNKVFRIITTYRKNKFTIQKTSLTIYLKHTYCILTCCSAE